MTLSLAGWSTQLNDDLEVEIDAIVGDDDRHGTSANEHVGNPLLAIWSVTVWPPFVDDGEAVSPIVDVRNLPFADALRIASAIIQSHRFNKASNCA